MSRIARAGRIRGRVQGVSYRWSTQEQAHRLGVVGWVRNCADGDVECHLEGAADAVAALERWLWQGPPAARVTAVELDDVACEYGADFRVRPG